MKILIDKHIAALGITNEDIENMLKALDIKVEGTYAPRWIEVVDLLRRAREAEAKKNRRIQKWEAAFSKLK